MDPNADNALPASKSISIVNKLKKLKLSRKYGGVLALVLVVILIGGAAFFYRNQNSSSTTGGVLGNEKAVEEQQKENEDAIKKIQDLTLVPVDETPEVAEIADTTKLDNQAFFSRAQNGDKVFVYRTAKRVVLYRPSTNQIIETGPLVEPTTVPAEQ